MADAVKLKEVHIDIRLCHTTIDTEAFNSFMGKYRHNKVPFKPYMTGPITLV